jgi:Fe-S-cluster containining protein
LVYDKILEEASNKKDINTSFLKSIAQKEVKDFHTVLKDAHRQAFSETDCLQCAHCCKTSPPLITPADIQRISKHLQLSRKQFMNHYVLSDVSGEMSFKTVPCVFLDSDQSCRIYDIRPEACRRFPHTDEKGYNKRYKLNVKNTMICPAAARVVDVLRSKLENI